MRASWSKRLLWGVVAGLAVIGLVWFAWPAPVAVDLTVVTKGPMEVTVDDDGKTHVRHIYTVSAPIAGKVLRISHPAGEGGISLHVGDEVIANDTVVAVMQPTAPGFLDLRSRQEIEAAVAAADGYVKYRVREIYGIRGAQTGGSRCLLSHRARAGAGARALANDLAPGPREGTVRCRQQ